ncbi:cell division protein CrgA [Auritidibacter ignavus]|uniref:cell division protein CrgA n=1 Tax=Auritidibacter ignavus TaxID=678932 RepID=UPI002107B4AF|nr:cell division protein CrgA [Auritidibacter ignavus]WHS36029.1 cell division protein CrgA [Auritidibacter ignavus]
MTNSDPTRREVLGEEIEPDPLPVWYKVIMFGLMIIGLIWIIVYYLSGATLPIQSIGAWNIVVGFGIAIIGFLMTTRWR